VVNINEQSGVKTKKSLSYIIENEFFIRF